MYSVPRTILPHGASFNGHPVTLHITYESTKDTFTLEVLRDSMLKSNMLSLRSIFAVNITDVVVCSADAQ